MPATVTQPGRGGEERSGTAAEARYGLPVGLIDRAIDAINRASVAADSVLMPNDPRLARADKLIEQGERATATIVGIDRFLDDEVTAHTLALEFATLSGTVRAGVRDTTIRGRERLRLGLQVPVRRDGEHAALDWPLLWQTWGLEPGVTAVRVLRSAPEDGVRDRALDARASNLLKSGTSVRAVIASVEPVRVMGMATENFHVRLQTEDGDELLIERDEIPFYARWLAAPGTVVPVAVAADDPTRAAVDWARSAEEHAPRCGEFQDQPPEGSAAAATDAVSREAATPAVSAPAPPVRAQVDGADPGEPIEGVGFEQWIEIDQDLTRDRVAPAKYDVYAQARGVPAGRWSHIDAAWKARVQGDWRLGARYGETFETIRKRRG